MWQTFHVSMTFCYLQILEHRTLYLTLFYVKESLIVLFLLIRFFEFENIDVYSVNK